MTNKNRVSKKPCVLTPTSSGKNANPKRDIFAHVWFFFKLMPNVVTLHIKSDSITSINGMDNGPEIRNEFAYILVAHIPVGSLPVGHDLPHDDTKAPDI